MISRDLSPSGRLGETRSIPSDHPRSIARGSPIEHASETFRRPLTHSPEAVIHSPGPTMAAWPITVTRSRCPPRLRPQDAEAVLQVVEGDALDQPGQDLPVRGILTPAGGGFHDVPSAGAVSSSFTSANCRARSVSALSPAKYMSSSSATASANSRRRRSVRWPRKIGQVAKVYSPV